MEAGLYQIVELIEDVPTAFLQAGLIGTIIFEYKTNKLYEVEFLTNSGDIFQCVELETRQIRVITKQEENKINTFSLYTLQQ